MTRLKVVAEKITIPPDVAAIFAETIALFALHVYVNSAGIRYVPLPTEREPLLIEAHPRGTMRPRRCCASCTLSGAAALRAIRSRRACERMARASSPITSASIQSPSVLSACRRTSTCVSAASAAGARVKSGHISTATNSSSRGLRASSAAMHAMAGWSTYAASAGTMRVRIRSYDSR